MIRSMLSRCICVTPSLSPGQQPNLFRCGMRPEQACLILRNSAEVVRRHYIRLEHVDAMARLEQAFNECATSVQQIVIKNRIKCPPDWFRTITSTILFGAKLLIVLDA